MGHVDSHDCTLAAAFSQGLCENASDASASESENRRIDARRLARLARVGGTSNVPHRFQQLQVTPWGCICTVVVTSFLQRFSFVIPQRAHHATALPNHGRQYHDRPAQYFFSAPSRSPLRTRSWQCLIIAVAVRKCPFTRLVSLARTAS